MCRHSDQHCCKYWTKSAPILQKLKQLRLVRIGRRTGSTSSCQVCTTSTTTQQVAKNRFDQFLPGMYLNHSSASCNAETHNYSHSLFQLTDGECNSRERTRIISSLLQSTSVNTLLHVSEDSIDIRSILLSCMSVSIV